MADLPSGHNRIAPFSGYVSPPGLSGGDAGDEGPSILEYFRAIRRRFWLVLLVGAVGLGFSAYAVSKTEMLLASKAVMQLAAESAAPSGGLAGLAASLGGGGGSLKSQVEVIRSRLILGQVVDSLGLRLQRKVSGVMYDNFRPTGIVDRVSVAADAGASTVQLEFGEDGVRVRASGGTTAEARYGEPVEVEGVRFTVPERPAREELELFVLTRDDAINTLLQTVSVYPREGANMVDVVVTGYDRAITQRVANATAEVYRRFSSSKAREEAERRREFVAEQLRTAEQLLHETQDELTEFRKRERLFNTRTKAMAEQAGGKELELRRAELEADRGVYQTLLGQLRREGGRNTGDVLRAIASAQSVTQNSVIEGLYAQLARYQGQRDSLMVGPNRSAASNPDLQRLDSLVALTEGRLVNATRNHMEMLDAQIAALDMIKTRTDSALDRLSNAEPEEARLLLRMESIAEAARDLRQRYYTAGMMEAGTTDQVTVLDRALPGEIAGTPPSRTLVLGLVFGLMVGAAGAITLDAANRSIRRREEMERLLHVPGLGVIPQIGNGTGRRLPLRLPGRPALPSNGRSGDGGSAELVTATKVHSPEAEAYRTLRTNLVFSPGIGALRTLVVTSAGGGEGKTTTAANLAVSFAQQGRKVLLVDCDLRRPRLHSLFKISREPGLAELLLGLAEVESVIRSTSVDNLAVLPAGSVPPVSATDLFAGGVVRALLASLEADFEVIILDTAPVLVSANATILSTQVDGVLVVVRAGRTARDAARQALQQLAAVGARVVGSVLNDPDAQATRYESYGADRSTKVGV